MAETVELGDIPASAAGTSVEPMIIKLSQKRS